MKPIHLFIVFFLLPFTSEVAAQNNFVSSQIGKQLAEHELNQTILKEKVGNVVNTKFNLLKNSHTAIAVAEPILFATYGEKTIVDQRPLMRYIKLKIIGSFLVKMPEKPRVQKKDIF